MKLTARLTGREILVKQDGGWGPDSKQILKSVARGARCDGGDLWIYEASLAAVAALQEAAALLQADLDLDPECKSMLDQANAVTEKEAGLRRIIQRYMDDPTLELPAYTTAGDPPPWRHQSIGVQWGIRVENLYLAHKPGLGKTRTGIDITRARIEAGDVRWPQQVWVDAHPSVIKPRHRIEDHWATKGGVLIVCPNVVLGTWYEELWRFQSITGVIVNRRARSTKLVRAGMQAWCHVCSYGSLDVLEDHEFDGIIADEFHYCASEDSFRMQRLAHLRSKAKWILGMSGTPVSNMLPSLWAQYFILDGGRSLGASFEEYRRRYLTGSNRRLEAKEGAEEEVSRRISRITYFLTMPQAFPDKAHKIQQVIRVDMTSEQRRYYEEVRTQAIADILAGQVSVEHVIQKLTKLLQICQGWVKDDDGRIQTFTSSKLRELEKMMTGDGDFTDRKTIIWVRFKEDLIKVHQMLNKHNVVHLTLHGQTRDRDAVKDAWNNDPRYRVCIGMIQMGIGVNLHVPNCVGLDGKPDRCSTTVFYGVDWPVTQLEQAMDRTYRGDQVETCLYRYLLSESVGVDDNGDEVQAMDERVYQTLQVKLQQSTSISEGSVTYIRHLLQC